MQILNEFNRNTHQSIDLDELYKLVFESVMIRRIVRSQIHEKEACGSARSCHRGRFQGICGRTLHRIELCPKGDR